MSKSSNIPKSDLLIVKANNLIEAKFRFSLWEMRVFTRMVSLLRRDDTEFKLHRIYIKDLIHFFGVVSKDDYATIKEVPKNLAKKQVEIPYLDEKGEKRWSILSLFPVVTAPDSDESGNAYLELMFNPMLKDTLLELKKLYSKYDIRNVIPLRSVYSFRIFELLKQYESIGKRSFEVQELKAILGANEKYKLYSDFKKRVIVKAQKDLKKYCDIAFTFEEVKHGRKVGVVIFYIFKNQPTVLITEPKKKVKEQPETEVVELIASKSTPLFLEIWPILQPFGITESTVQKCINDFSEDYLRKWVPYFQKIMKDPEKGQKIKNPAGYLIRLLKESPENIPSEQRKVAKYKRKKEESKNALIVKQIRELKQELFEKEKTLGLSLVNLNADLSREIMEIVAKQKPNYVTEGYSFVENYKQNRMFAVFAMKFIEQQFVGEFDALRKNYNAEITALESQKK